MKVVCIPNGQFVENCYLVIDEGTKDCAIVDPGEEAGLIARRVATEGVQPVAIWLTHAHIDHVLGVAHLKRETGAPVYLHAGDRPLYDHVPDQAAAFGMRADPLPAPDQTLEPGATLSVGRLAFQVRHTPGHSPGGVSFVGHGVVFTGDALFLGSIGRTDLPGGHGEALIRAIERELLTLSDDTIVYSGHGPETTIGYERRHNPFLSGAGRLA